MAATATIVPMEGCFLRHLIVLKGQRWSMSKCCWIAIQHEVFNILHIGHLVNNGLFKKWINSKLNDIECKFTSWATAFSEKFYRPKISLDKVISIRSEYSQTILM